jgi:hypothetical protein
MMLRNVISFWLCLAVIICVCFTCNYNINNYNDIHNFAIVEVKQRWSLIGWVTKNLLFRVFPCFEDTLSRWSWLHLQLLAPTNQYWARVMARYV